MDNFNPELEAVRLFKNPDYVSTIVVPLNKVAIDKMREDYSLTGVIRQFYELRLSLVLGALGKMDNILKPDLFSIVELVSSIDKGLNIVTGRDPDYEVAADDNIIYNLDVYLKVKDKKVKSSIALSNFDSEKKESTVFYNDELLLNPLYRFYPDIEPNLH